MKNKHAGSGLWAVILVSASVILAIPCLLLLFALEADMNIKCFSVDSQGCVYVGKYQEIEVYKDGEQIHSFSAKTSKSYAFVVQEDDTILLSTSSNVYVMDLDGTVLNTWPDRGNNTINTLLKHRNTYTDIRGNTYTLKGTLFPRIEKNKTEIVYHGSVGMLVVRGVVSILFAAFVGVIMVVGFRALYKQHGKKTN